MTDQKAQTNQNENQAVPQAAPKQQQQAPPKQQQQPMQPHFPSVEEAFSQGVRLDNEQNPDRLLSYVDNCAKRIMIGARGPMIALTQEQYDIKKYYTEKCVETVFGGAHTYTAPEPILVDAKEEQAKMERIQANIKEVQEAQKAGKELPELIEEAKEEAPPLAEWKPKVLVREAPEQDMVRVPDEYEEGDDAEKFPRPKTTPGEKEGTADMRLKVKTLEELTDQDKIFLKNQFLRQLNERYLRFVELAKRFDAMCFRDKELVRKLTTRRSRKCFTTNVISGDNSKTLELVPNPKGEKDLKNINMWYQEFNRIYLERQRILPTILDIIAECKRFQEQSTWKAVVGETVFDWEARLQKYILAPGNDELLSFINTSEMKFDNNTVEGDPIKNALMYHFFQVNPMIIIQLAIAKPTTEILFNDTEDLKTEVEEIAE